MASHVWPEPEHPTSLPAHLFSHHFLFFFCIFLHFFVELPALCLFSSYFCIFLFFFIFPFVHFSPGRALPLSAREVDFPQQKENPKVNKLRASSFFPFSVVRSLWVLSFFFRHILQFPSFVFERSFFLSFVHDNNFEKIWFYLTFGHFSDPKRFFLCFKHNLVENWPNICLLSPSSRPFRTCHNVKHHSLKPQTQTPQLEP